MRFTLLNKGEQMIMLGQRTFAYNGEIISFSTYIDVDSNGNYCYNQKLEEQTMKELEDLYNERYRKI